MKSFQKIRVMIVLLSILTVNVAALEVPTDFIESEVTDSTISFSWADNSSDEDSYFVCVKLKNGTFDDCSVALPPDTTSHIQTGISQYTNARYVALAYKEGETPIESNSRLVKTTHTWDGELQKCVNEDLGHGENNTTHTPTKSELESLIERFSCRSKEFNDMNPVQDLINITGIDLYENGITGSIPAWIGDLNNLTYLSLGRNQLTGSIPTWIGDLNNLTYLNLYTNRLTGSIPTEIKELIHLEGLGLGDNNLTSGPIPAWIGDLKELTLLNLGNINLTGSIPAWIGDLTKLHYLFLDRNNLRGEIPTSIVDVNDIYGTGLNMEHNCNLHSEDDSVVSYVDTYQNKGSSSSGYERILDTNTHECSNPSALVPTIMYLLN